jgi:hypothetical protein
MMHTRLRKTVKNNLVKLCVHIQYLSKLNMSQMIKSSFVPFQIDKNFNKIGFSFIHAFIYSSANQWVIS